MLNASVKYFSFVETWEHYFYDADTETDPRQEYRENVSPGKWRWNIITAIAVGSTSHYKDSSDIHLLFKIAFFSLSDQVNTWLSIFF